MLTQRRHLMSGNTFKIDACLTAPCFASGGATDRSDETTCRDFSLFMSGKKTVICCSALDIVNLLSASLNNQGSSFSLGKQQGY